MEAIECSSIQLRPGMILQMGQTRYRILHIQLSVAVLCQMQTSKLRFCSYPLEEILQHIQAGTTHIVGADCPKVLDVTRLSPDVQDDFRKKSKIISTIKTAYGPSYLGLKDIAAKEPLNRCIAGSGLSRPAVLTLIRRFLQSGQDVSSLLDGRTRRTSLQTPQYQIKTGRPSATGIIVNKTVARHFEEALADYKSGRATSMENAYIKLLNCHYSYWEDTAGGGQTHRILPASQIPSIRQFRYYISKHLATEDRDALKTSKQEQRNNKRLLLSDNLNGVQGPGDLFEMDEVEVDVSLVSRIDSTQVVGRPIVYVMVDVYSRLIIGYSVSFSNNSLQGLRNCFLSLLDDKIQFSQRYGLNISGDEWPSKVIPNRIRCDYGSEYRAKEAARIFSELGITRELVSPGTGSLKGQVEQLFHQIHCAQNSLLEGKGLIETRHDSNHHEEATLNIDDFEEVLLKFISSHNRQYLKDYPLTIEMSGEQIRPVPSEIWHYGCRHFGAPKVVQNEGQFLYSLLTPVTASISRRGINSNGLYYINLDDANLTSAIYNAGGKRVQKDGFRIDPTDVGTLYYIDHDNNLACAPLNLERTGNNFCGYTLEEYLVYRKRKQDLDRLGAVYEIERKAALQAAQEDIICMASGRKSRTKHKSGMVDSRRSEKLDRNQAYSIKDRLRSITDDSAPSDQLCLHTPDVKEAPMEETTLDFASAQLDAFLQEAEMHLNDP